MDIIAFAHEAGVAATKLLPRDEQKHLGQFMTPQAIARLMATRACATINQPKVRILDPAAGSGILAAAAVNALLHLESKPNEIEVVLYEIDRRMKPILLRLTKRMRQTAADFGAKLKVSIRVEDFLLSETATDICQFDLVISNPPYFKLNKSDVRSVRHAYAVYGQPNIYGLFMAACARILHPEGRWCFITPRSWTNGPYFAAVRRQMLRSLSISAIHIFESRENHFTDDEILQEAMITWAVARADMFDGSVMLSASGGVGDLTDSALRILPACDVIGGDADRVVTLPLNQQRGIKSFGSTLASYGLKVSTGPVVAFRAEEYIEGAKKRDTVPLLWMQHIRHMKICWPIQKKREHIRSCGKNAWMLVPNAHMVIMRRFSPKEDLRRITAAPYLGSLPGEVVGLENHTNYIYRPDGIMSSHEVYGLAAYLNSRVVDIHLRTVAGNTQVNATDLRNLPIPPMNIIVKIGRILSAKIAPTLDDADQAVEDILGLADHFHHIEVVQEG